MATGEETTLTLPDWRSRGELVSIFGRNVFVITAGERKRPAVVLVHGFPTSSADFHHIVSILSRRFFVVAHDHLGFGLSDKPLDYSYSLIEQAETAIALWRELGLKRVHMVAHDYGTSVATEILARRKRGIDMPKLETLTLSNGSVFLEMASLRLSQLILKNKTLGPIYARMASRSFFKRRIRGLLAEPESFPDHELDLMWAAIEHNNGRKLLTRISAYLDDRIRFAERWTDALGSLDIPAHVLWGSKDPIAVNAIANRLEEIIPNATLTWMDHLGHFPMLEDPGGYATALLDFLFAHATANKKKTG